MRRTPLKRTEFKRKPLQVKRTAKKPKSKKPTEAQVKLECDKLWAKIVKQLAGGVCEQCGLPAIHAHHQVGRSQSRLLRHSIQNGIALCGKCHFIFHNRESLTLWRWFEANRKDDFDFCMAWAHVTPKTKDKYDVVLARLKSLLESE